MSAQLLSISESYEKSNREVAEAFEKIDADTDPALIAELASEVVRRQFPCVEDRASLERSTLKAAYLLRDHPNEKVRGWFSMVLRRWATLADVRDLHVLLDFLRPEDDLVVRQTALQCIQSVYHSKSAEHYHTGLIKRCVELMLLYVQKDICLCAPMDALAVNAALAVSVLLPDDAARIAKKVKELEVWGLSRLLQVRWEELVAARKPEDAAGLKQALSVLVAEPAPSGILKANSG